MKIEKKLLFDDPIQRVDHIVAQEKLSYAKEPDGSVRATGPLTIKGEMRTSVQDRPQTFEEVLDMDVLAPVNKLGKLPFHLAVVGVEHAIEEDGIALTITLQIEGIQEEGASIPSQKSSLPVETSAPSSEDAPQHVDAEESPSNAENVTDDAFDDLFEDSDTTYTSYRMVVALPQDNYARIAKRYQVEEEALRSVNRDKQIQPKSLIVLPF